MPPAKDGRRGSKKGAFCEKVFTPPFHPPILSFFCLSPLFPAFSLPPPLLLQPGFALLFLSLLLKRTFIKTVEGNRRRRRRVERRGQRRNEEVAGKSRRLCFYSYKKNNARFQDVARKRKEKPFSCKEPLPPFSIPPRISRPPMVSGGGWPRNFCTYVCSTECGLEFWYRESHQLYIYSTRIRPSQRHAGE